VGIDVSFDRQPMVCLDGIVGYSHNPDCTLIRASGEHLPLVDEVFEKALFVHSLEHIPSPFNALSEVRRVLKKSGSVIIVIPNVAGDEHRERQRDKVDSGHLYSWSKHSIENLLKAVGFTNIKVEDVIGGYDLKVAAVK